MYVLTLSLGWEEENGNQRMKTVMVRNWIPLCPTEELCKECAQNE